MRSVSALFRLWSQDLHAGNFDFSATNFRSLLLPGSECRVFVENVVDADWDYFFRKLVHLSCDIVKFSFYLNQVQFWNGDWRGGVAGAVLAADEAQPVVNPPEHWRPSTPHGGFQYIPFGIPIRLSEKPHDSQVVDAGFQLIERKEFASCLLEEDRNGLLEEVLFEGKVSGEFQRFKPSIVHESLSESSLDLETTKCAGCGAEARFNIGLWLCENEPTSMVAEDKLHYDHLSARRAIVFSTRMIEKVFARFGKQGFLLEPVFLCGSDYGRVFRNLITRVNEYKIRQPTEGTRPLF